jgi:hypothetical protein
VYAALTSGLSGLQKREEIRGGNMDYQAINEAKDIL